MSALLALGTSLQDMVSSYAFSLIKFEILKRTVLATLMSALWPVYLLKMATAIDNPFAVARKRSEKAGEVLADTLINKAQGERPVTLIGYSLGARVVYSCLKSLAERKAFGLVESVVFIGAPVPSNSDNWRVMRSVVSGKVINVCSENDYILAFLYRATTLQFGVAGLQEIQDVEGVENMNLSKEVSGHLRYPELIGKILKRCGFEGINVEDTTIEEDKDEEIQLFDVEEDGGKVYGNPQALYPTPEGARGEEVNRSRPVEIGDGIPEREQEVGVASTTTAIAAVALRDDDESDDGGIMMLDNDSDGELAELPCEPEPEPDEPRESSKMVRMDEQKFLGSFPKPKNSTAAQMGNRIPHT
jgi:hypothetical protein